MRPMTVCTCWDEQQPEGGSAATAVAVTGAWADAASPLPVAQSAWPDGSISRLPPPPLGLLLAATGPTPPTATHSQVTCTGHSYVHAILQFLHMRKLDDKYRMQICNS